MVTAYDIIQDVWDCKLSTVNIFEKEIITLAASFVLNDINLSLLMYVRFLLMYSCLFLGPFTSLHHWSLIYQLSMYLKIQDELFSKYLMGKLSAPCFACWYKLVFCKTIAVVVLRQSWSDNTSHYYESSLC